MLLRRSQAYEKLEKPDEALIGLYFVLSLIWLLWLFSTAMYSLAVDAKRVYELEPKNYPKLPSTMYEDFIISF